MNIGIGAAATELIAMTGDDCEVPATWLIDFKRSFEQDPGIGVVFGNVIAGNHDNRFGFIPAYDRNGSCLVRKMTRLHHVGSFGACMGLRRHVWAQLRGFDGMLGTGSRFKSGEDLDFAIRAAQAGFAILETDRLRVVHNGFRTWAEAPGLTHGYLYGIGAVFGKHLRCRRWSIIPLYFQLGLRWAFGKPLLDYGKFPSRNLRLRAFLAGFYAASRSMIDREKCRFTV
jgi:hypothetical protein